MSSFLATFKEVNQRGSEVKSGNPKSSRPSSVAPGGASQRSGRVGFYMTSCRRLTGPTQKPPSPIERDHLLTQPAGPHIPPSSPLLLIISQRSSSPLPALHTPGHAHDLAHNVCLPPWTISSAPPPTFGALLITLQSPVQKLLPQGHLCSPHLFSALPVFT